MAAPERLIAAEAVDVVPLLFTSDPETVKGSEVVNPFKSTIAPNEMVVATADPKAALFPSFNVPALTVVAPE
jgi:hypothetical protein